MQIIKTSVIENIKHNFEELFPAEKKTAQYILDHLEEVTLLNISQLAKKAHASEASIVRMAKHLGYNGKNIFCLCKPHSFTLKFHLYK